MEGIINHPPKNPRTDLIPNLENVLLKDYTNICLSINVVAIIRRALCSLDVRKERSYLIRTVRKLNVSSCGNL